MHTCYVIYIRTSTHMYVYVCECNVCCTGYASRLPLLLHTGVATVSDAVVVAGKFVGLFDYSNYHNNGKVLTCHW